MHVVWYNIFVERVVKKRYILFIAVCTAILAACILLVGCSALPKLRFTTDELDLFVGDERNMALYAVFTPATTDEKSFTLKSDGECVDIRGTKIKAVSEGVCTVTATNGEYSAKIKINVTYRAVQNIELEVSGDVVRTVDNTQPLCFSAVLDEYSDPNIDIDWTVNGESVGSGDRYDFEPNGVGEYVVTASAGDLTKSETVCIYRATEAAGYSDGSLLQYRDFSPVRFYAVEKNDVNNPRSAYSWTVNGEVMSNASEFEFVPFSLGTYNIELFVNGVKRKVDDGDFCSVVATGERAPNCSVEFDDLGGVFVVWSDGGVARSVTIVDGNGERRVYNSSDARYSHLFGNGFFDASEYISPCSVLPKTLTVTVSADAAGEPFMFTQYPYEAEKHILNNVLCTNSFISSEAQAGQWVRELYATGSTTAEGYLSREVVEYKEEIISAAVSSAESLGIDATASVSGNIITVEFAPYVNAPTKSETATVRQTRIEIPHFESSSGTGLRAKDHKLKIERASESVDVSNTEQLLIAVGFGVRPLPSADTTAAHVYSAARTVLLNIMGRGYTDSQKAHAVYDWLQFCTLRVNGDDRSSVSNYLEGVFGNGKNAPAFVVSDLGAAKAFAFMCGMEGLSCEVASVDGDFFDRVKIDGLWYNVDVYDGEVRVSGTNNECCTHAGLFYADGTPDIANSAYDCSLSFYLQKHTQNGVYYDRYIDGNDDEDVIRAAVFGTFGVQSRGSFEVQLPNGKAMYANTDYGVELFVDLSGEKREQAIESIENAVVDHIEKYVKDNYDGEDIEARIEFYVKTIRVAQAGNIVWVTAQIPTFAVNS